MTDSSVLRAAAAIIEVQENKHPHLVSLRNRVLALARQLEAEKGEENHN